MTRYTVSNRPAGSVTSKRRSTWKQRSDCRTISSPLPGFHRACAPEIASATTVLGSCSESLSFAHSKTSHRSAHPAEEATKLALEDTSCTGSGQLFRTRSLLRRRGQTKFVDQIASARSQGALPTLRDSPNDAKSYGRKCVV